MATITREQLTKLATTGVNALKKDRGLLLLVKTPSAAPLKSLADAIAAAYPGEGPVPVHRIDGSVPVLNGGGFRLLKAGHQVRQDEDGTLVTESLGLSLPQDRPIILVVENFDSYPPNEQRAFAHLVDGEERLYGLAKGSVLIAGVSTKGKVEPGTVSRGFTYNLAPAG